MKTIFLLLLLPNAMHSIIIVKFQFLWLMWYVFRKADASGSKNIIDAVSGEKAFEMIYDIRISEEQMRENGYPRPGSRNGMAKIYKAPPATPNSIMDRYCRRCGKMFSVEHYDEKAVDECNYHAKSPGFRRGKLNQLLSDN